MTLTSPSLAAPAALPSHWTVRQQAAARSASRSQALTAANADLAHGLGFWSTPSPFDALPNFALPHAAAAPVAAAPTRPASGAVAPRATGAVKKSALQDPQSRRTLTREFVQSLLHLPQQEAALASGYGLTMVRTGLTDHTSSHLTLVPAVQAAVPRARGCPLAGTQVEERAARDGRLRGSGIMAEHNHRGAGAAFGVG